MQRRPVKIIRPEHRPVDPAWVVGDDLPLHLHEADLQAICEDIATQYGWLVYHETDSRKSPQGLPDLIMLSPLQADGSVVLALLELKTTKGKLTEAQEQWLLKLGHVSTLVTGVLRPAGWPQFVALCFDPSGAHDVPEEAPAAADD